MRERSRRLVAAIGRVIGLDEIMLTGALVLLALGFIEWWRPGAFLVPGAVLLWIALPKRSGFIERPPAPPPAKRRV